MTVEVQQSIGRAASVLTALAESKTGPLRASDIVRATGLGASTVARLLSSLEELGYVSKIADTQSYGIGAAILALASHGLNQNPLHRESRAAAQELAQRIGLSVNVGVRDGSSLIYLCHFEGAKAPKSHTMVGFRQPLHASALGKCLLIDMTEDERHAILGEDPLPRYTANTITTHEQLTAELAQIAILGTSTEDQELALGRFCIAAPIRTAVGDVAAAISISGRLSLIRGVDLDEVREDLIEVADRISVALGLISAVPH
ncbi:IclR family transcriptional regulator [Microbacterium allomyrinae]|uniref:IclR family transcriptional regulator n=1 Tax=Microbacterium allomyrinae TaxID=2830666 RepID=A0A9X1LW07_9MICO|nr:IclR family transcriptional regulator [Microbacterium allomyrinae]MCC2032763.1 IclR family transcriptional regulator [Microbacterium allomyrinae]